MIIGLVGNNCPVLFVKRNLADEWREWPFVAAVRVFCVTRINLLNMKM